MKIKELFTVPEGQKVTEKVFHRVLISSICSILLCMSCLVSTTWAWFTVSIENQGNEIQIVDLMVQINGAEIGDQATSGYPLADSETYAVQARITRGSASGTLLTDTRIPYIVMTVKPDSGGEQVYYGENAELSVTIQNLAATVSFGVVWSAEKPAGTLITENQLLTAAEETTTPSDNISEVTTETTAATTPQEESETTETTVSSATPETTGGILGETTVENP